MSQLSQHFTLIGGYYKCKYCTKQYKKDPSGSTSSRNKHISNQHPEVLKTKDAVKDVQQDFFGFRLTKNDLNRCMVRFFSEFNIPFHVSDSHSFLEFVKCLNINAKVNLYKAFLFLLHVFRHRTENSYQQLKHHPTRLNFVIMLPKWLRMKLFLLALTNILKAFENSSGKFI